MSDLMGQLRRSSFPNEVAEGRRRRRQQGDESSEIWPWGASLPPSWWPGGSGGQWVAVAAARVTMWLIFLVSANQRGFSERRGSAIGAGRARGEVGKGEFASLQVFQLGIGSGRAATPGGAPGGSDIQKHLMCLAGRRALGFFLVIFFLSSVFCDKACFTQRNARYPQHASMQPEGVKIPFAV